MIHLHMDRVAINKKLQDMNKKLQYMLCLIKPNTMLLSPRASNKRPRWSTYTSLGPPNKHRQLSCFAIVYFRVYAIIYFSILDFPELHVTGELHGC